MPRAEHECLQAMLSFEYSEWVAVDPIAAGTTMWAPTPGAEHGCQFS